MSVNVPNPGSYMQQIGQDIVNLRRAIDALLIDGAYLNTMGGAAFLEAAPFSMSTADATAIATAIGAITPTNPTVESIQAFLASTVSLTGGQ